MKTQREVNAIVALHERGYSPHAIARIMGCSQHTVTRYILQGEWRPRQRRPGKLAGLDGWLEECFLQYGGNANVLRQKLLAEHGIKVSLRTVERAVAPLRHRLKMTELISTHFEPAMSKP